MSTNNLPATQNAPAPIQVGLTDSASFELAQRVAKCFAMSTLVPKDYQNNLPNCVIALNMASRMGADPLMVIQNLHIVHGRPGWSAQFLIATFNKCGRFSALRYEFTGDPGTDAWGCRAKATELSTGEILTGTTVTIAMAKKEQWFQKNGSKWQTMPEQMLMYRAASWFVRAYAPEIAMGLQTAEEMRDTYDMDRQGDTYLVPVRGEVATDLNEIIEATPSNDVEKQEQPVQAAAIPEPMPSPSAPDPKPEEPPFEGGSVAHEVQAAKQGRPKQAELDAMRDVTEKAILDAGLELSAVEKAVGEFKNRWNVSDCAKIRGMIIPALRADKAGA